MTVLGDGSDDLAELGIPRHAAKAISGVVRTAVTRTMCELLPGVQDRPQACQWLVAAALSLTQMAPLAARSARPELSTGHANAAALPGILTHVAALELINRYQARHGELPAGGAGGEPPTPSAALVAARDSAAAAREAGGGAARERLRAYGEVIAGAMRRVLADDAGGAEGGWVLLAASTAMGLHRDVLPEPGRPRRRRAREEAGAAAAGFAYRYGHAVMLAAALSLLDDPGSPPGGAPGSAGTTDPTTMDPTDTDPPAAGAPTASRDVAEVGRTVPNDMRESLDWLAAARFDDTIAEAVDRTRRLDPTVEAVALSARAVSPTSEDPSGPPVPPTVPLELAGKLARQCAVAHALDLEELAVDCAERATYWYRCLDPSVRLGSQDAGYLAYSALTVAQAALAVGDVAGAQRAASESIASFQQHTALVTHVNWPDLMHALTVLGECQVLLGQIPAAHQSVTDLLYLLTELQKQTHGPVGTPGSMPPVWGLPVVPTGRDWRRMVKRMGALGKRMPRE
ncbi:hypothetical protein GCM10023322_31900 [Rugosimonospora acidiphila]|uniref:Uncharacterized protein n=1 Tax=Rugosimonospora acidiphila TaxID=556531 RepID=A0ABP9RTF1_9ACTN